MAACLYLPTLVNSASDDLENPDKLRYILKDLREARQAKSREGLQTLDHSELSVRLPFKYRMTSVQATFSASKSLFHGDQ